MSSLDRNFVPHPSFYYDLEIKSSSHNQPDTFYTYSQGKNLQKEQRMQHATLTCFRRIEPKP